MSGLYRQDCRRLHRLIGHYLAIQAWVRKLDCIVLNRFHLEKFLGLQKFKSTRVEWLKKDLHPWFPYQVPYYSTTSRSSIRTLFLSRKPIEPYLPGDRMNTDQRIAKMKKKSPKTALFSKSVSKRSVPDEKKMITYLTLLSAGLSKPK